MKLPIKVLKEIAQNYGHDHVIYFATEGKMQYIATYGRTIQECDQAAQFGDKLKDALGWPENLHAAPSRVRQLQKRVKELEAELDDTNTIMVPKNLLIEMVWALEYSVPRISQGFIMGTDDNAATLREKQDKSRIRAEQVLQALQLAALDM